MKDTLGGLEADIVACGACPRLVRWRTAAAAAPPRRYRDWTYWARPIPGFGDGKAGLLVVGLAPAAHGGNRTGRIFTGDRSGDWLFRALHQAGFANQPVSVDRNDGLSLEHARVAAAVRCAPPDNRPSPAEERRCRPFLDREIALVRPRVIVCLGGFAWKSVLAVLRDRGVTLPRPLPRFGHRAEARVGDLILLGSYHPSQQNTFTGRLTAPMLRQVFRRAAKLLEAKGSGTRPAT
jgi:uracil-DNA glycosylase family 4